MARRRAEIDDDQDETPPWMERDRAPSHRAPERDRASEPSHTVITWRALIIGALLAVAVAIGLVIGVRTLIARDPGATTASGAPGETPLIRAPAAPYKVKAAPDADGIGAGGPDGLGGNGAVLPSADALGAKGRIAPEALPETPQRPDRPPTDLLPGGRGAGEASPEAGEASAAGAEPPRAEAAPAPVAAPKPLRAKPKPKPTSDKTDIAASAPRIKKASAKPADQFELPAEDLARIAPAKPKPRAGTGALQIGAFSTREKADAAWAHFIQIHPALPQPHKQITAIDRDGTTLYRLRATGLASSADLCATLKAAGEKCLVAP